MQVLPRLRFHVADPVLARMRRMLPSSAHWQGPATGRYLLPQDLPTHGSFDYREVYPSSRVCWSDLGLSPEEAAVIDAASRRDDWTNQVRTGFCATIAGGRYVGRTHTLFTPADDFYGAAQFPHQMYPKTGIEHEQVRHARQGPLQEVPGRALLLLALPNLYHFLFEAVARICLARAAGYDPLAFDTYVSAEPKLGFQREYLAHLGIDVRRFVPAEALAHYRFGSLTFSNATCGLPPELVEMLKRELAGLPRRALPDPAGRRIYLSRGASYSARRIVNEAELIEQLARRGFTVAYPHELSVGQQRVLFEEADTIVSAHGAGLAHLLWCRPGTQVIELRAAEHVLGYWKLYWNLSSVSGLVHRWVTCRSLPNAARTDPQYADLEVPLATLAAMLEKCD